MAKIVILFLVMVQSVYFIKGDDPSLNSIGIVLLLTSSTAFFLAVVKFLKDPR